jgi:hypothetical protein
MSRYIKVSAAFGRALSVGSLRAAATDGSRDGFRVSQTAVAAYPKTHADWDLAPKTRLCLAKYRSLFATKFRQKCRRLSERLSHHACLSLHLNLNLYLNPQLSIALRAESCRSKYLPLFVTKYRQMCIQLRTRLHRQVCPQLNSELCRKLREQVYAALFAALFAKLFETLSEKTLAALFGSLFALKPRPLWASMCLALCRQRPRGRRPPGRGVGGRIVV